MSKVIVTGAGGFIGSAVVKTLLDKDAAVFGIDIDKNKLTQFEHYKNFTPIVADFSIYNTLDKLISDRQFDLFIHLAWAGSFGGEDYYNYKLHNKNIDAVCEACEISAKLLVKRFVFCGSSYQSMISDSAVFPVNYYGIIKRAAADYCMAMCGKNGVECNIAILTNTYGVGDTSQKAVNTFLKKLMNNEDLFLIVGDKCNDWVYISDTVSGIIAVSESPYSFKQYYVGHRNISTFKEKLIAMKDILHSKSELKFGEYKDETFVNYTDFDLDALYNDTGFECKSNFRESILKTAEWLKARNALDTYITND